MNHSETNKQERGFRPTIVTIGGFLGAGKTSLIVAAARLLHGRGVKAAALLNDQGSDLVDTREVAQLVRPLIRSQDLLVIETAETYRNIRRNICNFSSSFAIFKIESTPDVYGPAAGRVPIDYPRPPAAPYVVKRH